MSRLLRGELLKTRTTRSIHAFVAGGVAYTVLNVVIIAVASGRLDEVGEKEEALSGLPVLLMLWGIVGAAGEYRHHTAAPAALVARRDHGALLLARIGAYALTGLLIGALLVAVSVGLALPLLADHPGADLTPGEVTSVAAGNLAAFVLSAIMGAAVGAMVRSPVVGVVVVLLANFAVLPLVAGVAESTANYTPFGAAAVLVRSTHHTTLSPGAAAVVLSAWAIVLVVAAVAGERRRDLA
ncbi:ABC transporter permease [Embleya scabrispora]|uniref:ABC transporter permease n=1 Tax=Embleya scabrispora TaxID=159449 RepID=UPI00035D1142|nr:ABC transporter permease [Embleya scabrispora]MYS79852.1 ABC transporter permease [Streptomyces sp. SID5474]